MRIIKNNFTGKGKYKMEFIIQIAIKLTIGFTALLKSLTFRTLIDCKVASLLRL